MSMSVGAHVPLMKRHDHQLSAAYISASVGVNVNAHQALSMIILKTRG